MKACCSLLKILIKIFGCLSSCLFLTEWKHSDFNVFRGDDRALNHIFLLHWTKRPTKLAIPLSFVLLWQYPGKSNFNREQAYFIFRFQKGDSVLYQGKQGSKNMRQAHGRVFASWKRGWIGSRAKTSRPTPNGQPPPMRIPLQKVPPIVHTHEPITFKPWHKT